MIVFRKARRAERTLNDLDAYISGLGSEPIEWLEREVRRWGGFSYDDIEQLLAEGKLEDLELWRERYSKVINEIFAPMWIGAIEAGALKAARTVLSDSEDRVQSWLEKHGAELVANLSEETRRAIANVIISWRLKRLDPKIMARQIRPLIGLNERQVRANDKYRERVYENYLHMGEALARARSEKAAIRYASKQHRFRAETIIHTELAFAYNRGAHEGVQRAIAAGRMNRCEMIWTTAGTNRVCGRCLELKDKSIGFTDEAGVTLPPLHPRCRCAIMYREVNLEAIRSKSFAQLQNYVGELDDKTVREWYMYHDKRIREQIDQTPSMEGKAAVPSSCVTNTELKRLMRDQEKRRTSRSAHLEHFEGGQANGSVRRIEIA